MTFLTGPAVFSEGDSSYTATQQQQQHEAGYQQFDI
jgi:hypothetical protein